MCLTSLSFLCSNISERKPTQLLTMVTSWEGKGSEAYGHAGVLTYLYYLHFDSKTVLMWCGFFLGGWG